MTTAGVPHAAASVTDMPQPSRAEALVTSQACRYRVDELGVGDVAGERHPFGAVDLAHDFVEHLTLVAHADDRQRELRVAASAPRRRRG